MEDVVVKGRLVVAALVGFVTPGWPAATAVAAASSLGCSTSLADADVVVALFFLFLRDSLEKMSSSDDESPAVLRGLGGGGPVRRLMVRLAVLSV